MVLLCIDKVIDCLYCIFDLLFNESVEFKCLYKGFILFMFEWDYKWIC